MRGRTDRLRGLPKYVVSSTLTDVSAWVNSTVLEGDVLEQVAKLRDNLNGDILVYGSAPLVQTLLEHDLVDELRLMTFPFVLGSGERLFRETSDQTPVRLVATRTIGSSLVLLTYRPLRAEQGAQGPAWRSTGRAERSSARLRRCRSTAAAGSRPPSRPR